MKDLVLPVPETVSASYTVPVLAHGEGEANDDRPHAALGHGERRCGVPRAGVDRDIGQVPLGADASGREAERGPRDQQRLAGSAGLLAHVFAARRARSLPDGRLMPRNLVRPSLHTLISPARPGFDEGRYQPACVSFLAIAGW
jgi:hypothetical protein